MQKGEVFHMSSDPSLHQQKQKNMKTLHALLIGSLVLFLPLLVTGQNQIHAIVEQVSLNISDPTIEDQIEVTVSGYMFEGCVSFMHTQEEPLGFGDKTYILLGFDFHRPEGMFCTQALVPFTQTFALGYLPEGDYKIELFGDAFQNVTEEFEFYVSPPIVIEEPCPTYLLTFCNQFGSDCFKLITDDPEVIEISQSELNLNPWQRVHYPIGQVGPGDGGYNDNRPWHYYYHTVTLESQAIVNDTLFCASTTNELEANLDFWLEIGGCFRPTAYRITNAALVQSEPTIEMNLPANVTIECGDVHVDARPVRPMDDPCGEVIYTLEEYSITQVNGNLECEEVSIFELYANNTLVQIGESVVTYAHPVGDFSKDYIVDYDDFGLLINTYNLCEGMPNYNAVVDVDGSGCVDFDDYSLFAANWGLICESPCQIFTDLREQEDDNYQVSGKSLFGVFPNPTSDKIILSNPTFLAFFIEVGANIEIIDAKGQKVFNSKIEQPSIDISHLSAGQYYIKVADDYMHLTESFTKI